MSTADEIKKLNDLLRDRVITQEEFDSQKEKLLDSSTKTNSIDVSFNNIFCRKVSIDIGGFINYPWWPGMVLG